MTAETPAGGTPPRPAWPRWLGRRLNAALLLKLILLALLWLFFFRPEQRPPADAGHISARFRLPPAAPASGGPHP